MKRIIRLTLASTALASLVGCAGLPPYKAAGNDTLTTLKFGPTVGGALTLCDAGNCFSLASHDGEAMIPTGRPLLLGKVLVASDTYRMYSCNPMLGFTAAPDVKYYADFSLRAEHCFLSVYRIDPNSRVGLTFEPTARGLGHDSGGGKGWSGI